MTRTRKFALATGAMLLAAALSACSPDTQTYASSDCDRGDLARYDTDCGYWDGDGNFTTWYWVGSGGGYRPPNWYPMYPYGLSRPSNARLVAPKHQATPPGVSLYKPPAKSKTSTGSSSRTPSRSTSRSYTSSVRGGRR